MTQYDGELIRGTKEHLSYCRYQFRKYNVMDLVNHFWEFESYITDRLRQRKKYKNRNSHTSSNCQYSLAVQCINYIN